MAELGAASGDAGCARRVRRARIETRIASPSKLEPKVAPAACGGRGLKRHASSACCPAWSVAPAACGGRGLKLEIRYQSSLRGGLRPPRAAGED